MKKKNIIIGFIICLSVVLIGVIILGVRAFQNSRLIAEVNLVANLNVGYFDDGMQSDGIITNDDEQSIYLENEEMVKEVYVEEGENVSVGDLLMTYDVSSLAFSLKVKELEIESLKEQYNVAKDELDMLRHTKPSDPLPLPDPDNPTDLPKEIKVGDAYRYIGVGPDFIANLDNENEEDTTMRFLCTKDAFVLGSFLNQIHQESKIVVFEVHQDNKKDGALIASWQINGALLSDTYDKNARYDVLTGHQDVSVEQPNDIQMSYTVEELTKAIRDKERETKQLDLDIRKQELAYDDLENQMADGKVYAKINGVVKVVGNPENPPQDGSAFLQVTGSDGLYVRGTVSELQLANIQIGQEVIATSWENGETYTAIIDSIDHYPEDNSNYYYGQGNPNASYYGYTAYIENSDGLKNGQYLQLAISQSQDNEMSNSIYLPQCYVRQEDGQSYVFKEDDGRLKKQFVRTGKILWGSYIEVKSGITETDFIAFPYGKTAKEGVKTSASE